IYTAITGFAFFAGMGLPGMSAFISEVLVLLGAWQTHPFMVVFGAATAILTAGYLLWTFQRIYLGPLNEKYKDFPDLSFREAFTLVPLGIIVLILGVYPHAILGLLNTSLVHLNQVVLSIVLIDLAVRDKSRLGGLALIAAAASLLAIGLAPALPGAWLFHRMLVFDSFAIYFRTLIALAAVVAIWMSIGSAEVRSCDQGEYYAILLASTFAMFLMAESANLLMAYLALEFVSLTSYILTGFLRHNRRSLEAALKYLIYGGVASGTMIYGMSWIFGITGSLDFSVINKALSTPGHLPVLAVFIALVLILTGMGYKVSSVPFHMWAPDVYTGAPIPITTFLAIGSKAAGFALLTRFFFPAISHLAAGGSWTALAGVDWPQLLLFVCIITMTLGNLAALQQTNMKQLLAYSSIAQAGYALMGFVVLSNDGIRAMLFYLFAYYVMDAGAFLVVMIVANSTGREDVEAYRGLAWRGGIVPAVALTIFLFSLTGIPLTVGFIGKF